MSLSLGLKANKTFTDRANTAEKDIVGQIFEETDSDNSQSDSEGEITGNQHTLTLSQRKTNHYQNLVHREKPVSEQSAMQPGHIKYSGSEYIEYSSLSILALLI